VTDVLFAFAGLAAAFDALANLAPAESFFDASYNLRVLLALVLVSLTCGAIGPLVVGGRLAFFSDAMAYCAFASVSGGFILFTFGLAGVRLAKDFWDWGTQCAASWRTSARTWAGR
jgi:ABC 3 transport family